MGDGGLLGQMGEVSSKVVCNTSQKFVYSAVASRCYCCSPLSLDTAPWSAYKWSRVQGTDCRLAACMHDK